MEFKVTSNAYQLFTECNTRLKILHVQSSILKIDYKFMTEQIESPEILAHWHFSPEEWGEYTEYEKKFLVPVQFGKEKEADYVITEITENFFKK